MSSCLTGCSIPFPWMRCRCTKPWTTSWKFFEQNSYNLQWSSRQCASPLSAGRTQCWTWHITVPKRELAWFEPSFSLWDSLTSYNGWFRAREERQPPSRDHGELYWMRSSPITMDGLRITLRRSGSKRCSWSISSADEEDPMISRAILRALPTLAVSGWKSSALTSSLAKVVIFRREECSKDGWSGWLLAMCWRSSLDRHAKHTVWRATTRSRTSRSDQSDQDPIRGDSL